MIPGASRGIRIVDQYMGIPIIGRVAAGEPILSEQNIEDYQEVPRAHSIPVLITFYGYRVRVW